MKKHSFKHALLRGLTVVASLIAVYVFLAYLFLPALWRHYEHNPAMENDPKMTQTGAGLAGDPLNVGLVGSKEEVIRALLDAGWFPADPLSVRSSLGIAKSVVFDRPDPDAPVSNLYLWGRRQDLAFEQPVGSSAKERHHVRLWMSENKTKTGRDLWLGDASFDRSVGVSYTTGEITHHIAPDIDAERDKLMADLTRAGQLKEIYQVTGVGATLTGRNGGGDWYYTDGELTVGVISEDNKVLSRPPVELPNPPAVEFKNNSWAAVNQVVRSLGEEK